MNIFGTLKNLVAFPKFDSTEDFKQVAKEIRCKLGKQKFLLNKYLSEVFEISSQVDMTFAAKSANEIVSKILKNCFMIFNSEKEKEPNKYFYLVEKYINENPIDIKNLHTKVEYYATKIMLNHMNIFVGDFLKSLEEKIKLDCFSDLNHCYQEIAKIVGEDRMEYLNDVMCEVFFICPIGMAFIGQIAMNCVEMLIYRDPETSKQILEFILEN